MKTKRPRRYYTASVVAQIDAELGKGVAPSSIARELGVPASFVERAQRGERPGRARDARRGKSKAPAAPAASGEASAHLTRKQAETVRAELAAGRSPEDVAARNGVPLATVLQAGSTGLAGAVERAERREPAAAPKPAPEEEPERDEPKRDPPSAAQLVAVVQLGVGLTTRGLAVACRVPADNPELAKLSALTDDERGAVELLAPFAVDSVPELAEKAGPWMGWACAAAVLGIIAQRGLALRAIGKEHARSQPVRGVPRDGEDARRDSGRAARGPQPLPSDPRPRRNVDAFERPAGPAL